MQAECIDADHNECLDSHSCRQSERCVNTEGSYRCEPNNEQVCQKGYELDPVTEACVDVDECRRRAHTCQRDDQCLNLDGTYRCRCDQGYEFNTTTMRCADLDECVRHHGHTCSYNARCENTIGSFKCHCHDGYTLAADGRTCDGCPISSFCIPRRGRVPQRRGSLRAAVHERARLVPVHLPAGLHARHRRSLMRRH